MKKIYRVIVIACALFLPVTMFGQGVSVNTTGASAHASAMLDVSSINAGFLTPRMTQAQREAISNPAQGLLVFQTNGEPGFYYYTGSGWSRITNAADAANYVSGSGTLNYVPKWTPDGVTLGNSSIYDNGTYVGIGTATPTQELTVNGNIQLEGGARYLLFDGGHTYIRNNTAGNYIYFQTSTSTRFGIYGSSYIRSHIRHRFVDGTEASPGIISGTTNRTTTGIYWPADHTLAVSTNATERLRIDENGNVGVGTNLPTAQLHTTGTVRLANYSNGFLQVDASGDVSVGSGSDLFSAGTGLSWSGTTLNSVWTTSGSNIYNNNTAYVGIGTNNPVNTLDVLYEGSQRTARIRNTSNTASAHALFVSTTRTASDAYILNLDANGSSRMYVRSDGNVGIGTTSPSTQLHTTGGVRFQTLAGSGSRIVMADATGVLSASTASSAGLVSGSGTLNYVSKFTPDGVSLGNSQIFDNGTNVGIGTASPAQKLHVNGMVQSGGYRTTAGNTNYYHFTRNTGGAAVYINQADATSPILRLSSGTETANVGVVFTVENNGSTGVGTTTPTGRLHTYVSNAAVTTTTHNLYVQNLATNTTTDGINKYGGYITSNGTFTGSTGTATNNYGLYVSATGGDTNYGIYTVGTQYGIRGETSSNGGRGGYFRNSSTSTGTQYGIQALSSGAGASGTRYGVYGQVTGTGTTAYGVRGSVTGANTTNYGVYGDASNGTTNWAGYFTGNTYVGGNLGVGTTSPGVKIDVAGGAIRTNNQLISTATTGTAPLAVSSTTMVTNLNADLLDGNHASAFALASHTHAASHITSGEFDRARVRRMISADTRASNPNPDTYEPALQADFKTNTTDGLVDGGTYHGVLSYRPYGTGTDYSGGPMHQLGFTQNGNMWIRTSTGTTTWSAWKKMMSASDISGSTNYVAKFTGANSVGNSQIYDNGSSVGVGTTSPGYKLDVSGDIRSTNKIYANANGASYFRGGDDAELWDVNVANTLGIYGVQNSAVATLRLGSGAADISGSGGNIGIGTTSPSYKLHIAGTSYHYLDAQHYSYNALTTNYTNYAYQSNPSGSAAGNYWASFNYHTCSYNGTDYSGGMQGGVKGYAYWGREYTAGVQGWNYCDYGRSSGVHGYNNSGSTWGALGYKNSGSANYGGYFTSYTSGAGFLPNDHATGVGMGSYGGILGSWSRGEVMGMATSGELFALYNDGNVYTEGFSADIVDTDAGRKAAYAVTSTQIKIYTDGKSKISGNEVFVKFDSDFAQMLSKENLPNVTITPIGGWAPVYIKNISTEGFTVANADNASVNLDFTWIAVGKRIDSNNAGLPLDLENERFNQNIRGFMFNENELNNSATPMWWDGTQIRFDALPEKPVDMGKKMEEERKMMPSQNQ